MLLRIFFVLSLIAGLTICGGTGAFGGLSWLWALPLGIAGTFLGLLVLAFLFLWCVCLRVDMSVPQEHDSKFHRILADLYVEALISIMLLRVHPRGLEKTPKDGRFLLACNHLHLADPGVLLAHFRSSQLAFISKKENLKMFIVGPMIHKLMCQSLDREDDRAALKTILKCIKLLKEDEVSIGVFPEGYTSRDGKLHHFRSGVFKIAQKANVPIVVCTLQNTQNLFHNVLRLKPTHVQLHLVGVISPEQLKGRTAVDIGNQVHKMMADDLGPELVAEENAL